MYSQAFDSLKAHFPYRSKKVQSHTRNCLETWHMYYKSHLKIGKITRATNISTPRVNKSTEWCNSFVIVPKLNGTICLCLDPAWLNQALIRPKHRGPTINSIFSKLRNVHSLTLIDASSGLHILKLDKNYHMYLHLHINLADTGLWDFHLE